MRSFVCVFLFLVSAFQSKADSLIPNAFPFSGSYLGEYQQLYSSAAFSQPITLTGIDFSSAPGWAHTDLLNVQLSLSSVSSAKKLSSNFEANLGSDNSVVFAKSFSYTASADGSFDLNFAIAPFKYDPGQGNLLLDVMISGGGSSIFFQTTSDSILGRVYRNGGTGDARVQTNYGLLTRFDSTAVPEPGSLWLCLSLAFTACLVRRRWWLAARVRVVGAPEGNR